MAIQVRRGNYNDFDPTRMVAGEFAVCLDNGYVYMTLSPGNVIQLGTATVVESYAELSESWAKGTKNGTAVPSSDPAYHNNSKYYSEISANNSDNAEAWAVGQKGGTDVPSTDPTYHNNAKYYADIAEHAIEYVENTDASSTRIAYQAMVINGVTYMLKGTVYMEYTHTRQPNVDTDFVFTNEFITESKAIYVWSSIYGVSPKNAVTEDGQCTVTFNHTESVDLTCRIYII